ncbi:hypothetical protein AWENTII_011347 [Aspergillus wentii]
MTSVMFWVLSCLILMRTSCNTQVTHTNDLTSLALTCSALHSLAIPHMYSRFDIVWPDTLSSSDHPVGVDALSYGLATLVLGEDIFHQLPPSYRPVSPCPHCGCNDHQHHFASSSSETNGVPRIRRGNYYAQYTRKFSVGNGPLIWVQEYSVTKETGKMLGTLVALAIARMINLETFVWDMPTGVLRDVWIALSSLANRPGHECRLERVWVRWHDNSENAHRCLSGIPAAAVSTLALSGAGSLASSMAVPPLAQKYGHVEYPSLSILPPLKSLTVLDIDEPSYLEEMAVLIDRSRDRLKELRIGISSKVYQADWLKPLGDGPSEQDSSVNISTGWPRVGGVLGMLTNKPDTPSCPSSTTGDSPSRSQDPINDATDSQILQQINDLVLSAGDSVQNSSTTGEEPDVVNTPDSASTAPHPSIDLSDNKHSSQSPSRPLEKPYSHVSDSSTENQQQKLKLEILELERVALSIPAVLQVFDWTRITTLTILRCEGHEKLWRALRRQYTPSSLSRSSRYKGSNSPPEFPLKIKHLHTDTVSPYLLLFIKDAIAPNTLESLFLHEAPMYDSIVHIDAIYRNVLRKHRMSLRKVLIDSTERSSNGTEMSTNRWRKWMLNREMISFITSGRMPRLRELSMAMHSTDWHLFLQRLPYIPHLRALHIPKMGHMYRDPKELALQVLDIVTIRPEVGIGYVGITSKCFEILEGKRGDKDEYFVDADDTHSDAFAPPGNGWAGSDIDDDDSNDDGEDNSLDSVSELSDDQASSDEDETGSDSSRSQAIFRLREILFYDDKISIFKARHGTL